MTRSERLALLRARHDSLRAEGLLESPEIEPPDDEGDQPDDDDVRTIVESEN